MGIWLDFVQVALALGVGWLGWVLWHITRAQTAPQAPRPQWDTAQRTPIRPAAVIGRHVSDGEH